MSEVKLANIVVDPNIQVREVSKFTVSTYAQAMSTGAVFPPLTLEKNTNRIVCGNHRYYAYKKVKDPDECINVAFMVFENEAELIRYAARDNSKHGAPLSTWDKKRIVHRLTEHGDTAEEIAELLSVPVKRIEDWSGMKVAVVGEGTSPVYKPVKASIDVKTVKTVKAKDYNEHAKKDSGIPIKNAASMITRHLCNGWLDEADDKTLSNLRDLYEALDAFFERQAVV